MQIFRALAIAVALIGLVAAPAVVDAKPPKVSKKDKAKAKKLYEEGKVFHNSGQYDKAAEKYKEAYEIVSSPGLLYNLGQVHRLGGDKRLAIYYYERYLDADPEGAVSEKAQKFFTELQAALESEQEEQKKRAQEEERRKAELAKNEQEEEQEEANEEDEEEGEEEEATKVTESSGSGGILKWGGIGTAVAGLAVVGVGVKFGLDAKSASDELSNNTGAWTPELLALEAEGESAETKFLIFTAVGSALVVGGGVMYFLGYRSGKSAESQVAITPTAGKNNFGLSFSGRF